MTTEPPTTPATDRADTRTGAVARRLYDAFAASDRAAAEAVIAPDFHFTSPLDNRLDRDGFFRECWPASEAIDAFEIEHLAEGGDRVFVVYTARWTSGRSSRNTEVLTITGDRIHDVEVYFGWAVPHEVPAGEHRDPAASPAS